MTNVPPRALVFARLVRLPNIFTALADIALAMAVTGAAGQFGFDYVLLAASSACLYTSGMVWNDYFDIEQDARERAFRPLPSGQVSPRTAIVLASGLMLAGSILGFLVNWIAGSIAAALAAVVLLYDRFLKRTTLGPLGMGSCRFLNVLLGFTATEMAAVSVGLRLHLATIVGLYVAGVTWFARREASASQSNQLRCAALVMAAALILAVSVPLHVAEGSGSPLFPYLLVAFGFVIGVPAARAIEKPEPPRVQAAVKQAVLGIIGLDAVLATAISGSYGLFILLLLPPALWLGRRIYST
jgi:4-hydroxybenzoate polyprenyltransferase